MRNLGMPCSHDPISIALLSADQTPRSFAHGAVGLGIVAAMSAASNLIAALPRSEPIPIMSPRPRGDGWADAGEAGEEEELSESYTCVISHVAGSKRVYYDDGSDGLRRIYGASPGVFFQSPPSMKAAEFINRCYLCAKKLHGLDIFMYRGDKAFCSLECRCQQIMSDEHREKCNSGAMKQLEYYDVSPILFSAGVEYREKCNSGAMKQLEYYDVSPILFSAGVAAA